MYDVLKARLKQGKKTVAFPNEKPTLPMRFRGRPMADPILCGKGCQVCIQSCPTGAIQQINGKLQFDLGRCLFCTDCQEACPTQIIGFSQDYRLAARTREALVVSEKTTLLAAALDKKMQRLFGRSLRLRQVSAGGCNACEADVNVLNTVVFDLGRFGIQFVASPRHADGLLITGPVTANMKLALQKTYEAVPSPKIVIAVGACAISGGPFVDHPEVNNGIGDLFPVDLLIPGCPPHPITILDGLLRLLGRVQGEDTSYSFHTNFFNQPT